MTERRLTGQEAIDSARRRGIGVVFKHESYRTAVTLPPDVCEARLKLDGHPERFTVDAPVEPVVNFLCPDWGRTR